MPAAGKSALPPFTEAELKEMTKKAKEIIPERAAYYAPLVGVDYGRITIRHQRTRWGSCSAKGNLNFNCLLVLTPPEVLDSVVVHELCHRKYMNHSAAFHTLLDEVFPAYKSARKWLIAHEAELIGRLPAPQKKRKKTVRRTKLPGWFRLLAGGEP